MFGKLAAAAAVLLALASSASAVQTAAVKQGHGNVSVAGHFIRQGADADSYSVLAQIGIANRTGFGMEAVNIRDDVGSITLGSIFVQRGVYSNAAGFDAAAYGGFRFMHGSSDIREDIDTGGLLLGVVAQQRLLPKLTAYGRASVSFLDDTLGETEVALGYRVAPAVELTAGYKAYFINGDSLGGFTIGAAGLF